MIIDGKNAVLGRLASATAKKLLAGEEVTVINAESVIVTGRPDEIKQKYLKFKLIGSPQHGPFPPRQPNMIVRRTIRSMLPKEKKGRAALKKLKVFIGDNGMKGERAAVKNIRTNYITVGEIAKVIGWRG
ncbi:MAG: 50S ribosomal protein L13 [Candidatus Aenigmarchaeota archaeon]|nr:50S ribosomal protein L13 [Candidatus Aenigmarchaeota archaeon]